MGRERVSQLVATRQVHRLLHLHVQGEARLRVGTVGASDGARGRCKQLDGRIRPGRSTFLLYSRVLLGWRPQTTWHATAIRS